MPPFRRERPTPRPPGLGSRVEGRYELRAVLGAGGMGTVYLAYDHRLRREVAVKVLLRDIAADPAYLERFEREALALARLQHPNIIGLFDLVQSSSGDLHLVLELVRGRGLDELLAEGPLPWSRCAEIGAQVCSALEVAHGAGVIHRDIKPSNILIDAAGTVKVADFGVARLADAAPGTAVGLAVGTPDYFSPEQAQGAPVGPGADVYSLGVVLFEASTGRLPFASDDGFRGIAFQHIAAPIPDPAAVDATLPPEAARIIVACLAKESGDRPPTRELARALEESRGLPQERRPRRPPEDAQGEEPADDDGPVVPGTLVGEGATTPVPTLPAPTPPAPTQPAAPPPAPTQPAAPQPAATQPAPTQPVPTPTPPTEPRPPAEAPRRGAAETRVRRRSETDGPGGDPPPVAHGPSAGGGDRRRRTMIALAAGGVLVASVAGLLIGRAAQGGDEAQAEVPPRAVGAGTVSSSVPGDWVEAPSSVPGLRMEDGMAFSPPAGGGAVVVGRTAGSGPTLLPAGLRDVLEDPPGRGDRVRLAGGVGVRHTGLRVRGLDTPLTVVGLPTAEGVATVACTWEAAAAEAVRPACAAAAAALDVPPGQVVPVDPSPPYAGGLRRASALIAAARSRHLAALSEPATAAAQAEAADGLAGGYDAAIRRLGRPPLPTPAIRPLHGDIVDAMGAARRDLRAAADAARAGDGDAYAAAVASAVEADGRLWELWGRLAGYGYRVAT